LNQQEKIKTKLLDPNLGAKARSRLEDDLAEFETRKFEYAKVKQNRAAVQQYKTDIGTPPKSYDESEPIRKGDTVVVIRGRYKNKVGLVVRVQNSCGYIRLQGIDGELTFSKSSIAKHVYS